MKLATEILAHYLSQEQAEITFPNLQLSAKQIVELQCYKALYEIQQVVQDDTLNDAECFDRIEQIICALENIGSNGDFRHDFG